jgi:hypothetical protein
VTTETRGPARARGHRNRSRPDWCLRCYVSTVRFGTSSLYASGLPCVIAGSLVCMRFGRLGLWTERRFSDKPDDDGDMADTAR